MCVSFRSFVSCLFLKRLWGYNNSSVILFVCFFFLYFFSSCFPSGFVSMNSFSRKDLASVMCDICMYLVPKELETNLGGTESR